MTDAQVITALREHGLEAKPSRNSACTPFYLASAVSNVVEGPEVDENAVVTEEGLLECAFLSRRGLRAFFPDTSAPKFRTIRRVEGTQKVRIFLANLDCSMYFDESQRDRAAKFELALSDLERLLRDSL